ncbi:MAG TPA: DUF4194 domain-containing protein [Bryobacteraceae bacterium]|jgi:hypothetical protein|nr:DUF4194 domain-containing protein [Bryobacteraceae bacterium]
MNLPENEIASAELFPGDSGELPLDTRRVLAQLLAGPSLDGRRHSKLWPALLRDEPVIRARLCELFLELVIDRDLQVAFTRRAEVGDLDAPVLLRSAQLTFIDSVLLLFLRQRLTEADTQGQRAVVSMDEITQYLSVYERAANTDRAGFNRRMQASVEKIKKHSILQKIRSTEDRFEISPTLKLLFSAEEIVALHQLYQRMAAGETLPVLSSEPQENEMEA